MKTCFKCGGAKPLSEFYRHRAMADGTLNKCKECTKADVYQWRQANHAAVLEYERKRANLPHRVALRTQIVRRWREQNPARARAHVIVQGALKRGDLARGPCVVCGSAERVEAHHHDYTRPLDVTWYCPLHHRRHHAVNRATGT